MVFAVCGGKVGRIFGFSVKKPVCHCERSEAIFPYRSLTSAMLEGKIASLRSQ
jgi:hypothetical protein